MRERRLLHRALGAVTCPDGWSLRLVDDGFRAEWRGEGSRATVRGNVRTKPAIPHGQIICLSTPFGAGWLVLDCSTSGAPRTTTHWAVLCLARALNAAVQLSGVH
jgi:hypothetical protein